MRGISWLAEDVLARQQGLCSMKLVSAYWTVLHVFIALLSFRFEAWLEYFVKSWYVK
jgi:hypothetical protein